MADDADRSQQDAEMLEEMRVRLVASKAAQIPLGAPGDCDYCGEYFVRLVRGHCARCRDKLRLP